MFINSSQLKKLMKRDYKDVKLTIGNIDSGYSIMGSAWAVHIMHDGMPNIVKSLIIELAGILPAEEGGVLDVKDRIAAQAGKNSYTAWNEAGKVQNSLVNTILAVGCHTIVTMRSKMDYVMQENERGKTQPVKVGLAPVQRDDTEYEFDIVLDIARSHIATASKDVTFLDKYGEIITPELGRQLKAWLDDGVDPAQLLGEKPITKEQWTALSKPYKELPEVLQAAYKAFGYQSPSEIRQKDMEAIKAKTEEYAAAGGVPYA